MKKKKRCGEGEEEEEGGTRSSKRGLEEGQTVDRVERRAKCVPRFGVFRVFGRGGEERRGEGREGGEDGEGEEGVWGVQGGGGEERRGEGRGGREGGEVGKKRVRGREGENGGRQKERRDESQYNKQNKQVTGSQPLKQHENAKSYLLLPRSTILLSSTPDRSIPET